MELTKEDSQFITSVIENTLPKIECGNLKGIRVDWSRAKRRLATAQGYNQIKLSMIWWPYLTQEQRETTIVHEVCHLGDYYLSVVLKKYNSTGGHGKLWKTLMINAGQEPERTFKDKVPDALVKILVPHVGSCGCGKFRISESRYKKMHKASENGSVFTCADCNELFVF